MARTYEDPVIELSVRCGGPEHVLDFADATDEEAEVLLEVLDEVDAEQEASRIRETLTKQGHLL